MKKKTTITVLVLAVAALFYAGQTFGESGWKSDKGWAAGSRYNRMYNPAGNVTGTVIGALLSGSSYVMVPALASCPVTGTCNTMPVF